MPYIYKITNLVNNKVYIGKTAGSIQNRWNEHCSDYCRDHCKNRPLYSAMRKYGVDKFIIEPVEECTIEEINDREIYWISFYGSYNNGYNATLGGEGATVVDYDEVVSLYQKLQNQVSVAKYLGVTTITINKILQAKGISTKSAQEVTQTKVGIPVKQYTLSGAFIQEFPSARNAARSLGKNNQSAGSHISDVCRGKTKSAYGYLWSY